MKIEVSLTLEEQEEAYINYAREKAGLHGVDIKVFKVYLSLGQIVFVVDNEIKDN